MLPYDGQEVLSYFLKVVASFPGTRIFERLSATAWRSGVAPSAVLDRLSRGVKRSFDPMNILNPGVLGEDA
jgi:FAD/FMN-containing dehydrogenase